MDVGSEMLLMHYSTVSYVNNHVPAVFWPTLNGLNVDRCTAPWPAPSASSRRREFAPGVTMLIVSASQATKHVHVDGLHSNEPSGVLCPFARLAALPGRDGFGSANHVSLKQLELTVLIDHGSDLEARIHPFESLSSFCGRIL
jgi:hypothetical protein